jgi:anti-sigma regulatory factor (Ser/Thr protein kinase)
VKELKTETRLENIVMITEFVNEELEAMGCSESARIKIDIALDEIFSNIVKFAYGDEVGMVTVRMESPDDHPDEIMISFHDSGIPFDPLAAKEPDITLPASKRKKGGLGLFIVKKTMDDVSYEYRDGQNNLTFRKKVQE